MGEMVQELCQIVVSSLRCKLRVECYSTTTCLTVSLQNGSGGFRTMRRDGDGADGIVDGDPWIEHVDPTAVVLTAGEGSQFGHPHTEAMDAYETHVGTNHVYCTSRMGTLRVYGRQDGGG